MSESEIKVNEDAIVRLKRNIVIKVNKNLRDRGMNDNQMVHWIKKQIEEEVQCSLNQ